MEKSTFKQVEVVRRVLNLVRQHSITTAGNAQASTVFQYKCMKCNKKGHKAKDCKSQASERVKFTGTCNWCGKQGHKEKILSR